MEFELREWRESDAGAVARHANNPRIAANLRDGFPYPYTLDDARAYVNACAANDEARQCTRAIVINGEAAGSIGVFLQSDVYRKSGELGYWLAEPYWGRGVMSAAIRELCGYVFGRYDVVRIYAEPYANNIGSRRALEKAGFTLEGTLKRSVYKQGRLYDSCIYALLRE